MAFRRRVGRYPPKYKKRILELVRDRSIVQGLWRAISSRLSGDPEAVQVERLGRPYHVA